MPRCCLIVIDMQNDFLDKLERRSRTRLVDRTNELIEIFRAVECPIIWVTTSFRADLGDAFLEMRDRNIAVAIQGTRGAQIDSRLEQHDDDTIIVKKRYSAFFETNLDQLLSDTNAEFLVLAGVNTHACVRMTAIDAYQRDLRLLLATECIDSLDAEHARISMDYMDGKIGAAKTNAELSAMLQAM